jgi:metallo-beta-lactamase class B
MKRKKILCGLLILFIFASYAYSLENNSIQIAPDLRIKNIGTNVWIHVSAIEMPPWGMVEANGLVILQGKSMMIVDTPWNNEQTKSLVEWFVHKYSVEKIITVICHYHQDNLGGLAWIHAQKYKSLALQRTCEICEERNLPMPQETFNSMLTYDLAGLPVELFFPGKGHTEDSICVYLPEQKILFGGCSVKALKNKTLGNTAEAYLYDWPKSILKMKAKYKNAEIVVPGHGLEGSKTLLDHTLKLLSNAGY